MTQRQAALLELVELRRRQLGQKLPVDEDQAKAVAEIVDEMAVPDFFEQ